MNYPLQFSFKIFAFAPQIFIRDASGANVCYVKQQLFKLKEKIQVYTSPAMTSLLAEINADRIIDFSATYTIADANGAPFAAIRRQGLRSLWRTHYDVLENGALAYTIREGNPWTKMADGIFGQVPIIGLLSGYLFHPRYDVFDTQSRLVSSLHKKPALMEGKFELRKHLDVPNDITIVMALFMTALLERQRG